MQNAEPIFDSQEAGLYAGYVTGNLAETRDFFVNTLGFEVRFESAWFVLLGLGAHQIGLLLPDQAAQAPMFRAVYPGAGAWITFDVPDVDRVYQQATAAGLAIAVPLRDEPWGERHFSITAPNGLALDIVTYQGALAE